MATRLVWGVCAGVAALVLASCGASVPQSPSTGSGTQWRLNAGGSAQSNALQGLQFYPGTITINAGDTVTWTFASLEPHTVTFLKMGQATPPPPTDPAAEAPAGGSSYDGSAFTSSGFRAGGFSYTLTFPKAGTYVYYCLIHQPVMQGTIVVNPSGTAYPFTEDGYSNQATSLLQSDMNLAAASVSEFPYAPGGPHIAAG
ncbi:MAG TPA: plastocyanin/azurin family copper-binding protein, partial [Candidatus Baltobacteraceae bacterium]|nr:plastocyanin/azurin family copper-binding protein [Candidatus Baltobacteraceae bacterium]